MSVRQTASQQYRGIVDRAAMAAGSKAMMRPPEGWIATARKALGMSGAQLARRLGVTRARVSQAEHAEIDGGVTLKTMEAFAEGMGCRFVYAIVPYDGRIGDLIEAQARRKAIPIVERAATHMALESQGLNADENRAEVDRIASDLMRTLPSDLWDEP